MTTGRHIPINTAVPIGSEKILLVDDEQLVRSVTGSMLRKLGYEVFYAPDGEIAVDTFSQLKDVINVVMLDITMPKMDGLECIKHLIAIDPDVKVIFCSGHDMESQTDKLISLGAKGIIQKPYQLKKLAQTIHQALNC